MKTSRSKGLASERQRLVDQVFRSCMGVDRRTLVAIRSEIHAARFAQRGMGLAPAALLEWEPTEHDLQIMISRNCMGEGEWDYFPAYSNPPRYVSRQRIEQLTAKAERGTANAEELRKMEAMLADVESGIRHWRAKHARARQKEQELTNLARSISNRAFGGHTGALL